MALMAIIKWSLSGWSSSVHWKYNILLKTYNINFEKPYLSKCHKIARSEIYKKTQTLWALNVKMVNTLNIKKPKLSLLRVKVFTKKFQ